MTILDLTVPPFQILIGTFDITDAVDSFTVLHPLAERGTPLNWSGSIELSYLINQAEFAESFDDWLNPGRWAAGAYPVDFYIDGFLFQTLRIARNGYTFEEDPENGSALAQIQLTDLLELLDSYSPPQDAPGLTVGASVRWEDGVKALIEAAIAQVNAERARRGQTPITVAIAINYTDVPDVFTAPKTVSGSLVKTAQEWAGERGYWLWCDNEVIRLAPYPQAGAPIYQFSRKQVDPFARVQGLDEPLNKLVVTCANQKADPCAAVYPRIRPEYGAKLDGSPYIRRRVIEDRQRLGNQVTETIEEQAAIIFAYPPGYTFSGDPYATITSSITRKTTTLSTAENKILKVEEDVDRAIGCFEDFRDSFPVASWSALMPSCQKVVTTYKTDSQGQLTSIETDEYAPAFILYSINGSSPLVQQVEATLRYKTVERWERECGDTYKKITTRYSAPIATGNTPNGLVFDSEAEEPNSNPPEQPYWEAEYPLTTELLTGQAEFDYAGFSAYVPNQDEIQANSLVDNAGCDRLARLEGNLRWQRYYAREISHGYHPSLLTYQPFQIAHVHTGAVIRDGLTVSMGDSETGDRKKFEISYRGNLLGVIPPVPESPGSAAIPAPLISQILELPSTVEQFGDWFIIGGPSSYTFESEVEQFGDWELTVNPVPLDFDWIVVSADSVAVSGGQVVSSQGDFSEIVVVGDAVSVTGNNVDATGSSADWASILCSGGEVVCSGGFVVSS